MKIDVTFVTGIKVMDFPFGNQKDLPGKFSLVCIQVGLGISGTG